MSYQITPDQSQCFQAVRQGFLQVDGLPFSDILSEDRIAQTFEAEDALFGQEADDVYTPAPTLWAFLSQVIHSWPKPSRPEWMDQATYDRLPDEITVRELTVHVTMHLDDLRSTSPDMDSAIRVRPLF